MGCVCCPLGNFISSLLYAVERISTCAACAALVACMLLTIIVSCVFGVALGYHFCVVEHNANAMDKATIGDLSSGGAELDTRRRNPGGPPPRPPPPGAVLPHPASYLLEGDAGQRGRRRSLPLPALNGTAAAASASSASAASAASAADRLARRGVVERAVFERAPMGRLLRRFKRDASSAFNLTAPFLANVSTI